MYGNFYGNVYGNFYGKFDGYFLRNVHDYMCGYLRANTLTVIVLQYFYVTFSAGFIILRFYGCVTVTLNATDTCTVTCTVTLTVTVTATLRLF